jgi:acyl-[acyl-carrier-protein] desaturase
MNEFEKYFEMSEQSGWRTTDLDWKRIDFNNISEFDKQLILAVSIIEHGVPYYTEAWSRVAGISEEWELWQFVTLWASEEHRHSFSLKKLADILDITGDARYYDKAAKGEFYYNQVAESDFARLHKEHCPTDCYSTLGGMITYAAIQELATAKFYQAAVKRTKSRFIKELLSLIAKDELKHYSYYSQAVKRYFEKSKNQQQYLDEVYHAVINFSMPHLIYPVKFGFFENEDVMSGFDYLEIKLRVAKFLSFNKGLVKRLALTKEYRDVPLEKSEQLQNA